MKIQLNYDLTLDTVIEDGRLRFRVIATDKESLQDGEGKTHVGIGDNINEAFANVEYQLLMDYVYPRPQGR